jgi:hypothetical protein
VTPPLPTCCDRQRSIGPPDLPDFLAPIVTEAATLSPTRWSRWRADPRSARSDGDQRTRPTRARRVRRTARSRSRSAFEISNADSYDQRGGGRSVLVSDPNLLTADHHVRDLEALRQCLRLEQVSLQGISRGPRLAALYTAEHPAEVSRLLLVSPMHAAIPVRSRTPGEARCRTRNSDDRASGRGRQRIATASDEDVLALCREQLRIGMSAYLVDQRRVA